MTMGWFGTRISQDEIGPTNSVTLHGVDPSLLPSRADLEVAAERKGQKVCLFLRFASFHTESTCFDAVGTSLDLAGGRYTLASMDPKKSFIVRIDRPIRVRGLGPQA
jgi:hypothetical protein